MSKIPQPLFDRVLVKLDNQEEMTPSGLYLATSSEGMDEDLHRAKIVAVGPGRISEEGTVVEMTVEVGQIVVFDKNHAASFKVAGVEYHILDEVSILAVI